MGNSICRVGEWEGSRALPLRDPSRFNGFLPSPLYLDDENEKKERTKKAKRGQSDKKRWLAAHAMLCYTLGRVPSLLLCR